MVHRRSIEGEEIIFGNQGDLWGNAMTWWDHDTGSVWSQPLGEAILGPRTGERLELLPSTLGDWASWRSLHPETLALDVAAGPSGVGLSDVAIVVEIGDDSVAYPVDDLREAGVIDGVISGIEIAVILTTADEWTVATRRVADTVVELEFRDDTLVDTVTGTVFDPLRGVGLEGPLRGEILVPIPAFTSFVRDFPTFRPTGRIWTPAEES